LYLTVKYTVLPRSENSMTPEAKVKKALEQNLALIESRGLKIPSAFLDYCHKENLRSDKALTPKAWDRAMALVQFVIAQRQMLSKRAVPVSSALLKRTWGYNYKRILEKLIDLKIIECCSDYSTVSMKCKTYKVCDSLIPYLSSKDPRQVGKRKKLPKKVFDGYADLVRAQHAETVRLANKNPVHEICWRTSVALQDDLGLQNKPGYGKYTVDRAGRIHEPIIQMESSSRMRLLKSRTKITHNFDVKNMLPRAVILGGSVSFSKAFQNLLCDGTKDFYQTLSEAAGELCDKEMKVYEREGCKSLRDYMKLDVNRILQAPYPQINLLTNKVASSAFIRGMAKLGLYKDILLLEDFIAKTRKAPSGGMYDFYVEIETRIINGVIAVIAKETPDAQILRQHDGIICEEAIAPRVEELLENSLNKEFGPKGLHHKVEVFQNKKIPSQTETIQERKSILSLSYVADNTSTQVVVKPTGPPLADIKRQTSMLAAACRPSKHLNNIMAW